MKSLLLLFLTFSVLSSGYCQQGAPNPFEDTGFENFTQDNWTDYLKDNMKDYYDEKVAGEIVKKAYKYLEDNPGADPEDIAEDIVNDFLQKVGGDVIDQLLQEVGYAKVLDKMYEAILQNLPRGSGFVVSDPILTQKIDVDKKKQNDKIMLRTAIENWINNRIERRTNQTYDLQRAEIEHKKRVGVTEHLKIADLEYDHFVSLEVEIPEQVLDYANQIKNIYTSAQATFEKGKDLYAELNVSASDFLIPQKLNDLENLTNQIITSDMGSWEMINQRKKTLGKAYLQLADRARQRAIDLQEKLKHDEYLKMSEGDRLKAQQIAADYMEDFLRYKKKADELINESYENEGTQKKDSYMANYTRLLQLKNLSEQ